MLGRPVGAENMIARASLTHSIPPNREDSAWGGLRSTSTIGKGKTN